MDDIISTNSNKKKFICKECNAVFNTPIDLARHSRLNHKKDHKETIKEANKNKAKKHRKKKEKQIENNIIQKEENKMPDTINISKSEVELMLERLKLENERKFDKFATKDDINKILDNLTKQQSLVVPPQITPPAPAVTNPELDKINQAINDINKTIKSLPANMATTTDITGIQEQIKEVSTKTENLCQQFPELCKQIDELKKQQIKESTLKEREKRLKELKELSNNDNHHSSTCPHCKENIPHSIQGHTGRTTKDIIQAIENCPECKSGLEKFAKEYIAAHPEILKTEEPKSEVSKSEQTSQKSKPVFTGFITNRSN